MANEADLKLIEIGEFEQTASVSGSGEEFIVVRKADGKTYKMSTADLKAFLGTVQVQVPRAISPTDPTPTLDGIYEPTINGVYANAGGLERLSTDGYVRFIKSGATWVKVNTPLPQAENKIPDWTAGTYTLGKQRIRNGQIWEVVVASTNREPGTETGDESTWHWKPKTDGGEYFSSFTKEGYIAVTGAVTGSGGFINTDFVFYKGGDISVSGYASASTVLLFYYDKYFKPISGYATTAGVKNNIIILASSVPVNTMFIVSQARTSDANAKLVLSNREQVTYKSLAEYKNEILLLPELPETVSTPTFNEDGTPLNVIHRDSANRIIRTDAFAFSETQIIETRTFENAVKTFTTDLATLKTTIS